MRIRPIPKPQALIVGALNDNGRHLFITRTFGDSEILSLPSITILQGSDPISALSDLFQKQFGIDAQVHEVIYQTSHNSGSRKKKRWIPVLVFRITTKSAFAKPAPGTGFIWLSLEDARKRKLARESEWMR